MVPLGEVETSNIHARVDELDQNVNIVDGLSKRADNLSSAHRNIDAFKDARELNSSGGVLANLFRGIYHICLSNAWI